MRVAPARRYDPIAISNEGTVVAEYAPDSVDSQEYQSESALEQQFISLLESQAYERLTVTSEAGLIANLRTQLELLNQVVFTDEEWNRFFDERLANQSAGIIEKTILIQEDHIQILKRDDGSTKNIMLLDKANIHNNHLQVLNQYTVAQGGHAGESVGNRYDVTILVNGLPMVHVELKRRGVDIREAFNQIDRYQRDSFWAGSGLFEYVQLFVISNGTLTKYYSNTTRDRHIKESTSGRKRSKQTSNSFEFTSWWADATNKPILDLMAFAKTFFAKHSLLSVLTRYCVLTSDRTLLVMRPYQIVATERVLQKIATSTSYRQLGTVAAGGYVWHTTGSGKTLTSFKTAQLASRLPGVDKVIFVVDRKDLDYQTMREYDRFEKGAANSNTSTRVLKQQLQDPSARIIITTIQKLTTFINANKGHAVFGGHVVMIFDECHRSQFGDMRKAITKAFKKYNLFGFTGTPIFAVNASAGGSEGLSTTPQAFGCYLHGDPRNCPAEPHQMAIHTYTIKDAIADKNVLPFKIDYISTMKLGSVDDKEVSAIDRERALLSPKRVSDITSYVLEHFDQKTKRSIGYTHSIVTNVNDMASRHQGAVEEFKQSQRIKGFNALFAVASIHAARIYYTQFQAQQQLIPQDQRLKVSVIYSYAANPDIEDGDLDEEEFDATGLSGDDRSFLELAIKDYNVMFGTSYDTSADKFQNYYKDVSLRMKNREIDLLIVVNMFLTGFDATTLNTLFVDKNLKSHGLMQAFSRTNRILNSVKVSGNIVTFRDLEEETNDAIALFGNRDAHGIVLLKSYREYYHNYSEIVSHLLQEFPLGHPIVNEAAQKEFITQFGAVLRLENILTSFDEFENNEMLTERQSQDYRSVYLDLYAEFRKGAAIERESIVDDIVFEIELIKQVDINVDYILMLIEKHRAKFSDVRDKEIRAEIARAVDSSPSLRNKRDLIEEFVDQITPKGSVDHEWRVFVAEHRDAELREIIDRENLRPEASREFIKSSLRNGEVPRTGTAITKVLPPVSRFTKDGNRSEKKRHVLAVIGQFVERYFGLGVDLD